MRIVNLLDRTSTDQYYLLSYIPKGVPIQKILKHVLADLALLHNEEGNVLQLLSCSHLHRKHGI